MGVFSISQLEQLSGIKAHTIRIWEKRYDALQPSRTEGNTRFYDSGQLRRLLNIVSLIDDDHRISELGSLPDEDLFRMVKQREEGLPARQDYYIHQLIAAGMNFEEESFRTILSRCIHRFGMPDGYTQVIHPLLVKTGIWWSCNSISTAHEHFITHLIRQKIMATSDSLPLTQKGRRWLLFLPEDEFHDSGLLMAQLLLRSAGERVYYIGSNTPLSALAEAYGAIRPDIVLTFFIHRNSPENFQAYLQSLEKIIFRGTICISAEPGLKSGLHFSKRVKWLHTLRDLENESNSRRPAKTMDLYE